MTHRRHSFNRSQPILPNFPDLGGLNLQNMHIFLLSPLLSKSILSLTNALPSAILEDDVLQIPLLWKQ